MALSCSMAPPGYLVVHMDPFQLAGFKEVMPHMAAFHHVWTEPLRANVCY